MNEKFWNWLFAEFDAMSDEEFIAFVEESEKTPEIPLHFPEEQQ